MDEKILEWTTTSNNLPLEDLSDLSNVSFRHVFFSDVFTKEEGAGIDDVNIMEDEGAIHPMTANQAEVIEDFGSDDGWASWIIDNDILLGYDGSSNRTFEIVKEDDFFQVSNLIAQARHGFSNDAQAGTVRFYIPNTEYNLFFGEIDDWSAPSEMAILIYDDLNIDGQIDNNSAFGYSLINNNELDIRPYRNGYILEFAIDGPSEFFIVYKEEVDNAEEVLLNDLEATGINSTTALVEWSTFSETEVIGFVVEVGEDGINFDSLTFIANLGTDTTGASYDVTDNETEKACVMHYRVYAIGNSTEWIYLGLDTANFIFLDQVDIDSFNATITGEEDVTINWGTHKEKCNDRFEIEYSTNGMISIY